MKKLLAKDFIVDPSRLFLPIGQTLEHLQEAYAECLDNIMTSLVGGAPIQPAGGYVMWGVTDVVSGSDHTIGEGAIYYFLNAAAWSGATTYGQYALISRSGYEYVSLQASNTNHDPATSPTWWGKVGVHLSGQIFQVDATTLLALANAVVGKIVPTYASVDPTTYTDGSTASVHANFKMVFTDAVSGTGVIDFADLVVINKWRSYTPTLSADDGSSPVVGGFTGTPVASYHYRGSTLKLKVSVTLVAILATVKNLYFTLPKTPFNAAGSGTPISPYNIYGFNMAKRGDISNSAYTAQQVSMGLRHTGAGSALAVSKIDGTAFAASASGTVDFEITLGWRKDNE